LDFILADPVMLGRSVVAFDAIVEEALLLRGNLVFASAKGFIHVKKISNSKSFRINI